VSAQPIDISFYLDYTLTQRHPEDPKGMSLFARI